MLLLRCDRAQKAVSVPFLLRKQHTQYPFCTIRVYKCMLLNISIFHIDPISLCCSHLVKGNLTWMKARKENNLINTHLFLDCSRFTYEIAPVFVLMEQLTLKKMREIIGWPDGEGDGIFSPGKNRNGSSVTLRGCLNRIWATVFTADRAHLVSAGGAISNMYSVMIARYKFFPEVKTKGMAAAPRLVLFTSEHVSLTLPLYRWLL